MDNIGLVGNTGVNSPTMNSLLRNIPVQISSVKDQVSAQVEQAINSTTDQSQLVSALNEISTVMQATASTMREVARNTKDTATNIKAAGINIV
jgi:methyl-accepting chemotaxis protein